MQADAPGQCAGRPAVVDLPQFHTVRCTKTVLYCLSHAGSALVPWTCMHAVPGKVLSVHWELSSTLVSPPHLA